MNQQHHRRAAVPASTMSGSSAAPVTARAPDIAGPPLRISRAPFREPGAEAAPVIRLQPRSDAISERPLVGARLRRAEVIEIGRPEERRRVASIATSVAQACMEVLAGARPIGQLSRWLDPSSFARLQLRSAMVREQRERAKHLPEAGIHKLHRGAKVRSVHLCRPSPTAYEATLVVNEPTRSRAVAIRLEYRRDAWKVATLEVG